MSKTLTLAEVAAHDREEDCYLIIGNERTGGAKVYDVTKYLDEHPGGDAVLLELAGKYADDMFEDIGHSMNARQQLKEFLVGTLDATEEELQALRAPAHTGNGDSFLLVAVAWALIAAVGGYFVFMA